MYGPIRIAGVQILAQAFLSQGKATCPCSAFVGRFEETGDYFHATFDHEREIYGGSHYWQSGPFPHEALSNAMESFTQAVERDNRQFLIKGTPLTPGDIGQELYEKERTRCVFHGWTNEEGEVSGNGWTVVIEGTPAEADQLITYGGDAGEWDFHLLPTNGRE